MASRPGSRKLPGLAEELAFSSSTQICSEVAALREEKEEAERRAEAGLKNLHQKDEKITLLQVRCSSETFHMFLQVQLETALERVSALEMEAQPLKTHEVFFFIQNFWLTSLNGSLLLQVGCQFAFVEDGAEEVKETEMREK